MNENQAAWRLFLDPVGATGGLAVWATYDTVRLEVNREDAGLAVDFLPDAAAGLSQALGGRNDGLAFGCVTDERGIAVGGIGTVFAPRPAAALDFLLHFADMEATGTVRGEGIDAMVAALHDASRYARTTGSEQWRELDTYVMGAAIAASELDLSVLTPLRRMSQAMGFVAERNQRSA